MNEAIFENVNETNYIDRIINSFSYEERLNFFEREISSRNIKGLNLLKYIFTEEEVIKTLKDNFGNATVAIMVNTSYRRLLFHLLNILSDDNKVKEVLKLDHTIIKYISSDIFNTDELRIKFINSIKKTKENCELLDRAINLVIKDIKDFDLKLKCIDKISEFYPIDELHELMDVINEENLDHYFNDLGLSDLTKSILVLRCSNAQISKKYFLKLNNDFAKVNASKRFDKSYIHEINNLLNSNETMLDNNFSFEDIKELLLSIKDPNSRVSMLINYNDFIKYNCLSLLSEEEKINILISMNDGNLLFDGLDHLRSRLSVIRVLTFYKGEFPRYSEEYNKILALYAGMHNIDINNLIELSKVTSLKIIHYLSNKNILSLLNMEDKYFRKFISFFNTNNTKLSTHTLSNIFNTFSNRAFDFKFEYIKHYYNNAVTYAKNGKEKEAKKILRNIFIEIDTDALKGYTVDSLYDLLSEGNLTALNDFHELCDKYTIFKKEKEVKKITNKFNNSLDNEFEVTSSIKEILNHIDIDLIYENYLLNMTDKFNDKEKQLLKNRELFNKIYKFKLNPSNISSDIKQSMFIFDRIMDKFYNFYKNDDDIITILNNSKVKKAHVLPEVDSKFLIEIMTHINASEIKSKLLDNDELCKKVNKCLKDYSFLAFNQKFKRIQIEADTYCDPEVVANILLNYEDIINGLTNMEASKGMVSILDSADTYTTSSKVYKYIFGEENFKYITLNPPPNRGTALRSERREESVINYIKCINRKRVAVPSFDEDVKANGKDINVVVGNFTNPINLTLGERTKSCMRIAGAGDDIYHFCLNNENAFHIILNDPKTGKLISRASGFRNGNTIFLNQLRESLLSEYNSDDLVEVIKEVANKFIEKSKDSEHPIENIFISPDLAMEKYKNKIKNIGISNIFKGLEDEIEFYNLRPSMAVVLASTSNERFAPIKLGNENVQYYPVQRDKVRLAKNPTEAVNHINAIEKMLSGKPIQNITIPENKYELCYYGEDWYVAVDKNGNISKKIMSKSKDFEQAFKEMYEVLEILEKDENKLSKK